MGLTPYRPRQWVTSQPLAATIMIDYPGQGDAVQYQPSGIGASLPTGPTTYIFDCVILADHDQRLRKTEHPVQTGASISDHAFIEPATLSLDVGMSDAMDSFVQTWGGLNDSKSVSAYQTMILLMFSRQPLTITTRLRTYEDMIIENVHPQESAKTFGGLRMRVEFGQVFRAQVQTTTVSAQPQTTETNELGSVTVTQPTDAQRENNSVSGIENVPVVTAPVDLFPEGGPPPPTTVNGAGEWSSNNVQSLQGLPALK